MIDLKQDKPEKEQQLDATNNSKSDDNTTSSTSKNSEDVSKNSVSSDKNESLSTSKPEETTTMSPIIRDDHVDTTKKKSHKEERSCLLDKEIEQPNNSTEQESWLSHSATNKTEGEEISITSNKEKESSPFCDQEGTSKSNVTSTGTSNINVNGVESSPACMANKTMEKEEEMKPVETQEGFCDKEKGNITESKETDVISNISNMNDSSPPTSDKNNDKTNKGDNDHEDDDIGGEGFVALQEATQTTEEIASSMSEKKRSHSPLLPPNKANNNNPYLYKRVRVIKGQFKGLTGKVVQLHSRGWWSLDNPEMNGKSIHPRFCELLDKIAPEEVERFYKYRSRGRSLPSIILRQQEQGRREKKHDEKGQTEEVSRQHPQRSTRRTSSKATQRSALPPSKKARISSQSNTSPRKLGGLSKTKRVIITSSVKDYARTLLQPSLPQQEQRKAPMTQVLPPFILGSHAEGQEKTHEALRHLSPNSRVEIFNRKNGRILKGNDAVLVKDLQSVLRRHAEYEPIIPQPHTNGVNNSNEDYYREARSSLNARVNKDVQPQTKVRASAVEGRRVKITAGPYSGMSGKVESCIPGNWYLVSDLSRKNKFGLDYIVHAKNLEIFPVQSNYAT